MKTSELQLIQERLPEINSRPPDIYFRFCEEHENKHTGSRIIRITNDGLENPNGAIIPIWLLMTILLEDTQTPVQLIAFEWHGKLWGGMVHTEEINSQKPSRRGVEECLISGYTRL